MCSLCSSNLDRMTAFWKAFRHVQCPNLADYGPMPGVDLKPTPVIVGYQALQWTRL
jgi:hypothetical protein